MIAKSRKPVVASSSLITGQAQQIKMLKNKKSHRPFVSGCRVNQSAIQATTAARTSA
jgi:hypothetical protein